MKSKTKNKSSLRQVQHREKREEAKSREMADLKKENNHLKRQVARLNKQLTKTLDAQGEKEEAALEEHVETSAMKCKECSSINVKMLKLGHITLLVCKDCNWRQKQ